jgi:hypothetical protein
MAIYRFYNYGVTQINLDIKVAHGLLLIENNDNVPTVDIEADPSKLYDLKDILNLEFGMRYAGEVVDGVLVPPAPPPPPEE